MATQAIESVPALPYPVSTDIQVFSDDGKWSDYDRWFMRSNDDLKSLYRGTIHLPKTEDDDVDMSHSAWARTALWILQEYPNCVYVYTEA